MLKLLVSLVGLLFRSHTGLLAENMALRHQLSVLQRTARRPRLKTRDRVFWVWLSRIWPQWRSALLSVQPETVVKMAPAGLQALLALEVSSEPAGTDVREGRDLGADPTNLAREPTLGLPQDP